MRDVAEVGADSTSATVARNVARNNFKGGHPGGGGTPTYTLYGYVPL